jgi:Tfp pilus assembly protein PilO
VSLWRRILVERRSVIVPLAVFLAANVVALMAAVMPLQRSVAGAMDKRNEAYARLNTAKADLADIERAAGAKRQAADDLQTFYEKTLPPTSSAARNQVQFWPEKTASSLGLKYTSIETTPPTEVRDSRLSRVTSRFTLRGDYSNIRKFVYAVEAAEQFLIIDKISLAQMGSQQTNSSTLEFEVTIATYFLGGGK